jgi:endonuclease I
VDDFAVTYVGNENAHHLRNALLSSYDITTDWRGTVYSGMMLKWDYHKHTCDISMLGYVANILKKFQHDTQRHPQHTPSK